jgi:hypothetical protein
MTRAAGSRVAAGLIAALLPGSLSAQVIAGVVRADSTRQAVAGVEVLLEDPRRQTLTNDEGRYRLEAPAGTRIVLFRRVGYQPVRMRVTVGKRDTVALDAVLVRQPVQELPEVGVTVRPLPAPGSVLAAFEERRRLGIGTFIDSTELRRFEGRRLADLLRGRTSVRIVAYQEGPGFVEYRAASSTARDDNGDYCWTSVFLDGIPIYKARSTSMRPPDLNRDFDVSSLMGIEFYRSSAQVPMEFGTGRDSDCGVLVLWTRRGR